MKLIAAFEALKALLVLLAGLEVLRFMHQDIQAAAQQVLRHFHVDPVARLPRLILRLADQVTDRMLWMIVIAAIAYAVLRFAEAYGLWRNLSWAKWLGAVSGGIYVPFELYALHERPSALRLATLLANVAIVLYLGRSIVLDRRDRSRPTLEKPS